VRRVLLFASIAVLIALAAAVIVRDRGGQPETQVGGSTASPTPNDTSSAEPPTPVQPTSPTVPATPATEPPTRGASSASCVGGWVTPRPNTPMFTDPLGIIRRTAPVEGDFVVVDMRMFVGPEAPPVDDKGYLQDIRRWYVKLYVAEDLSYQGRFLVEQRVFGRGVSAVAPYDTEGFQAPDWSGFQFDSADTARRAYPGLPGRWSGVRYDFVNGGAGLEIPGLPDELTGCLDGT
jgi:hypothetical protein